MANQSRNREHGVALVFSLIALLILTAITASLIMLSGTETSVNYNYRTEEVVFFAAKSGIYEALDRMQQSNANSISCNIPTALPGTVQTVAPGCTLPPSGVLYLINSGSSLSVQPWNTANTYVDDELCHEGYTIAGMSSAPPDVPCTTLPTGSSWYATVSSNYPWSGTSTAMPYEWVRINWKQNSSQTYLSGGPSSPVTSKYSVNSTQPDSTPVCWNGGSEVLLSTPAGVTPAYTNCEQYQTCAATSPSLSTPVLLITALAITSNGSRQMVQAEAALNPPSMTVSPCGISDPYGFFAYGTTCSTPVFDIGGNAFVDGYNSSTPPGTYAGTHAAHYGSVGTNGGLLAQGSSTNIGGTVYVTNPGPVKNPGPPPQYAPGSCPIDFSISGNPHYGGIAQSTVLTPPTVTIPPNSSTTDVSSGTIVPGNYRNISVGAHGSITLTAPGTYNIDCISMGSFGTIVLSPPTKAITINISGTGCASAPLTFNSHATLENCTVSGGSCTTPGVASNIQINYAGSGTITMEGGPGCYAILNAPNAAVVLHGGADYYGTIMANTIDDSGGTNIHFDAADTTISGHSASTATASATGSYNTLAFRSLSY